MHHAVWSVVQGLLFGYPKFSQMPVIVGLLGLPPCPVSRHLPEPASSRHFDKNGTRLENVVSVDIVDTAAVAVVASSTVPA